MRDFVDYGFYFAMGCCLFALGAMVIALIIAMFKDLFR
jgi:hypothetical protein